MPLDTIIVHPDDRPTVTGDWELYERTAAEKGILLRVHPGGVRDALVVTDAPDAEPRSLDVRDYEGLVQPPRRHWEHLLRQLLELDPTGA